ncbi:G5 domain-containing protein [uncultured Megasphaera sp.]|uniref:G5 domain-containing protein n=1 Tax=uncultured Megasphaera sp. TaxID=165188 RepID=UPI002657FBBC|nr:G5 domain-containing protein [uncultured Megasphaera sp.]
MNKRYQGPITRMYLTLIALLIMVSLTGFIDKGKSVTFQADGVTRSVYTHAINEEALMREHNIAIGPHDEIDMTTPELTEGSHVTVRRAVPVVLEHKNQKQTVQSAKQTVQDVASQYGYDPAAYRPYGDGTAAVTPGMTIRIGTLSRKEITEDEVVPFAIESIPDETLGKGEEKVLQAGQNGRKRVKTNIVSLDGQVVGREHVSTTLITEMKPLIRHVGTKETVEINTGTVSKFKEVFTMEATAYLPTDGNGEGITKMGTWARHGVVAVDPNVIPLGTRVFIPGYGVATAEDTGGDILGNRIDLCMEEYEACMAFGRRMVPVYILE